MTRPGAPRPLAIRPGIPMLLGTVSRLPVLTLTLALAFAGPSVAQVEDAPWDEPTMREAVAEWSQLATDHQVLTRLSADPERAADLERAAVDLGLEAGILSATLSANLEARRQELEGQILSELLEEGQRGQEFLARVLLETMATMSVPARQHWRRPLTQLRHRLRQEGVMEVTWALPAAADPAIQAELGELVLPPAEETPAWIAGRLLVGPRDERLARTWGRRVDVNRADSKALARLPGIGATKAQRIVAFREANGPLDSLDQLDGLPGFAGGTMESLWRWAKAGDAVHPKKTWTVLFYLNGDDPRIELFAYLLLQGLERVGSSATQNLVVQLDRLDRRTALLAGAGNLDFFGAENVAGARRFYVRRDEDPGLDAIQDLPVSRRHAHAARTGSAMREPLGEVASDQWESLRDFITWGRTQYPSDHLAVVYVGHGAALALSPDVSSSDPGFLLPGMDVPQLAQALRDGSPDRPIDLFVAHACSMATVEVVWELGGLVDHFVGSEDLAYLVPFHHRWLEGLSAMGEDVRAVSGAVVRAYGDHIETHHPRAGDYYGTTFSAFDLGAFEALKPAIAEMVRRLPEAAFRSLLEKAPWIDRESEATMPQVDLLHLLQGMATETADPLRELAASFGHPLPRDHRAAGYTFTDTFPAGSPLVAEVHNATDSWARGLTMMIPMGSRPSPAAGRILGERWIEDRLGVTAFARETGLLAVLDQLR